MNNIFPITKTYQSQMLTVLRLRNPEVQWLTKQEDSRAMLSKNFQKKVMLLVKSEDRVTDNQFCHYLKDNL